ncbi:MAG: Ig-like domain-containing protein, partial [Pseudomonadota bacterium]
ADGTVSLVGLADGFEFLRLDAVEFRPASGSSVNTPPVANNDVALTDEDVAVDIDALFNDTDDDGDNLFFVQASAQNGSVVINADETLTYTPDADFNGTDTVTYMVSDGNGGSNSADVTVTVAAQPDAPVAVDDAAVTSENTPVTVDVLANDTDADGEALTITTASALSGTVAINADETLTYTPGLDSSGPDTISYTISDVTGRTASANVAVDVGAPVTSVRVEAEDFALTSGFFQFGNVIRLPVQQGGRADLAVASVGLASGLYDVDLIVIDETDGVSDLSLLVDDVAVTTFSLDGGVTAGGSAANLRTFTASDVAIGADGTVSLVGLADGFEFLRLDAVEFRPASGSSVNTPPIANDDAAMTEGLVQSFDWSAFLSDLDADDGIAADTFRFADGPTFADVAFQDAFNSQIVTTASPAGPNGAGVFQQTAQIHFLDLDDTTGEILHASNIADVNWSYILA